MKKTTLAAATLCCLTATVVTSCKKTNSTTPDNNANAINEVFAGLRTTPQTFSVQAGRDTVFTGAQGTILHFYPNSFKNASGAIVTSGAVSIELTEMYAPGDMVANRAPTTDADGKVLQSGGEVKIVAMQNGNKLDANKYGLGFKQAGYSGDPMSLYYQGAANADSTVKWTVSDPTKEYNTAWGTTKDTSSLSNKAFYMFDSCTKFDFINCDHPHDWGAGIAVTNIKVILPDNSLTSGMSVFLVYPEINGSTMVAVFRDKTYTKSISDVPVGKPYKIAVISYKDGNAYYFETSGTTAVNMVVNAAPQKETMGDIKTRLHAL